MTSTVKNNKNNKRLNSGNILYLLNKWHIKLILSSMNTNFVPSKDALNLKMHVQLHQWYTNTNLFLFHCNLNGCIIRGNVRCSKTYFLKWKKTHFEYLTLQKIIYSGLHCISMRSIKASSSGGNVYRTFLCRQEWKYINRLTVLWKL